MKLCVFQGTFNPIHKAHLMMAEFVISNYDFDKILFIPAYRPPHKDYDKSLCQHRLNMVKLALSDYPKFEVSDIEYRNERISYTYLTILNLYKNYDVEGKINFIIGTDAFKKIESWYKSDNLKNLVNFIVFARENELDDRIFSDLKLKGYSFNLAAMNFEDISSTQIRICLKEGKDITNFVSNNVKGYIEENGLYKN